MAVRRHQSWALFSWCLWIRIPCVLLLLSYSFLFVLLMFHSKGHPKALLWCCCKVICTLLHQRGRHDRAKEYSSKIANHWDWVDVFGYIDLHLRYCATLCGSLVFFVSISKYDQPAASLERITGAKHTPHFYDVPVPQSCLTTDSDHLDALFNMCWSNRGCFFLVTSTSSTAEVWLDFGISIRCLGVDHSCSLFDGLGMSLFPGSLDERMDRHGISWTSNSSLQQWTLATFFS